MNDLPKTRKEALMLGVAKYFTGKPCKRNHLTTRDVHNGCELCALERRAQNAETARERSRTWSANNPDKAKEKLKAWRAKNRTKEYEVNKVWKANNPDKVLAISARYRADKLNATPPWLTAQHKLEIEQKYLLAKIHESVTGMKWHVDHIVPLKGRKVCGLHLPWNLQVIPAVENVRKYNTFETE